jgi:hypothetical protein
MILLPVSGDSEKSLFLAIDEMEERAAILEHDGGFSRDEAEQRAWDELDIPGFLDRRVARGC